MVINVCCCLKKNQGTPRPNLDLNVCFCLKKNQNAPRPLFLTFSALVASPKKTTLHGPARGLLNRGKKKNNKSGSAPPPPPPPPPALLVRRK